MVQFYFGVPVYLRISIISASVAVLLLLKTTTSFSAEIENPSLWELPLESETVAAQLISAGAVMSDELLRRSTLSLDKILNQAGTDGVWWRPGVTALGDPNVNRFILLPVLEAAIALKPYANRIPEWHRWARALRQSVDFQRSAYSGGISWDWGAQYKGQYPNQDIYYALILARASAFFEVPAWRTEADQVVNDIGEKVMPGGAMHYIGDENESPTYHALTEALLMRYLDVTSYTRAASILSKTAAYWPKVLSDQGVAEYWSAPWWKQQWRELPPGSLSIANRFLIDPSLLEIEKNIQKRKAFSSKLFELYTTLLPKQITRNATSPPFASPRSNALRITIDDDIRGVRFRKGDWYSGFTQGRGFRSNFSGGIISKNVPDRPLDSAFRGANIQIITRSRGDFGYWLSSSQDQTRLSMISSSSAAMAASYYLQPTTINDGHHRENQETPWHVNQLWYSGPEGLIGSIAADAVQNSDTKSIVGRILLGPNAVIPIAARSWQTGDLQIRLFSCADEVSVENLGGDFPIKQADWPGIKFIKHLDGSKKGDFFSYGVWIGPIDLQPPEQILVKDHGTSLSASWKTSSFTLRLIAERLDFSSENIVPPPAALTRACPE